MKKPWALVKLNRRRTFLFVVILLSSAVGMVFFLRLVETERHLLRLKIVRQTQDQGKPVVLFRLEGAESRRLVIDKGLTFPAALPQTLCWVTVVSSTGFPIPTSLASVIRLQ